MNSSQGALGGPLGVDKAPPNHYQRRISSSIFSTHRLVAACSRTSFAKHTTGARPTPVGPSHFHFFDDDAFT